MKTGLLLVVHGTPSNLDDIPAFLSNIRRGRPTPPAIVEEVRRRYEAIGGRSPLLDTTREQARLVSERLGLPALVTSRMWHPYFEETLREAAQQSFERLIVLVMAPHSAHVYEPPLREAAKKLQEQGVAVPELRVADNFGNEPGLLQAHAQLVREVLSKMDPHEVASTILIPSAHSLPLRVVEAGDPYPHLVERTASGVVSLLGADALPVLQAFQSQGMTNDPWLGPDLPSVFTRARNAGARTVLVVPVGFVADHVETLYDLDIEAKAIAEGFGLSFARSACPGTHPHLIDALEHAARLLL